MTDNKKPVRSITSWGDIVPKSNLRADQQGRKLTVPELEDLGIARRVREIEYFSQLPEAHALEGRRVLEELVAEQLGLTRSDREPAKLLARAQAAQNPIHARAMKVLALSQSTATGRN